MTKDTSDVVASKRCKICGIEKPLAAFRPEAKGVLGRQARCKECRNAVDRDRRSHAPAAKERRAILSFLKRADTAARKEASAKANQEASKKRRARSPEQREHKRAHVMVRAAIKRGDLRRPEACSKCGKMTKVHGHHADYSKPLDVEWLCVSCHRITHLLLEEKGGAYLSTLPPEKLLPAEPKRVRDDGEMLTLDGETLNVTQWATKIGITRQNLHKRLDRWGVERALTEPRRRYPARASIGGGNG